MNDDNKAKYINHLIDIAASMLLTTVFTLLGYGIWYLSPEFFWSILWLIGYLVFRKA